MAIYYLNPVSHSEVYCLVSLLFFQVIVKQCFEFSYFLKSLSSSVNLPASIKKKSLWITKKKKKEYIFIGSIWVK